ncbi:MAG: saccharopine dehydrogenase NADP-binding domain-containing protein [Acidobacteria bacterium]|nr:saccharopine dehydrogenase NADP-binding domain-containing protein [Acidobacteriota bacterium]
MLLLCLLGSGLMARGALHEFLRHDDVSGVVVVDRSAEALAAFRAEVGDSRVRFEQLDVTDTAALHAVLEPCTGAFAAMHYGLNLALTRAAIATRTHLVDLGGNNDVVRAQLALDDEARAAGVSIVPDCGLAPGMVSMLTAWGLRHFPWAREVRIRVGGLPLEPREPLRYERLFSVEGLINEYVEPPLVLRNGVASIAEPLGDLEMLSFAEPVGTLEAFNTSGGVSTLIDTFGDRLDWLDYKTLRYPGHAHAMRWLLTLGLMSDAPVQVDGVNVVPRRLLGDAIERHVPICERDRTVCRVTFSGRDGSGPRTQALDVIDTFDEATGLTAMMRTTAFPAATTSLMQCHGEVLRPGVLPQERVLDPDRYMERLLATGIDVSGRS